MAAGGGGLDSSRLRRLARRPANGSARAPAAAGDGEPAPEQCDLCAAPLPAEHQHLLDTSERRLMCCCRACALLFDRRAASRGHYRLIPDRRRRIVDFELDDVAWERLAIPVDIAFFFENSELERVVAFYPGPAGATESQLGLDAWSELEVGNPVLGAMEADVEALLVNRARGARDHWLVPIDDCYDLVGLMRTRWRGLSGGREVWEEIASFFERLERRAKAVDRHGERTERNQEEATWQTTRR